ncbi:MAG: hypothetical protein IT379_41420 [Deltaproteobacteria bacterium]|nr:hypothetical protein [Deltaproteobacteria bacterium]
MAKTKRRSERARVDEQQLNAAVADSPFKAWHVPEPQLLFANGSPGPDPKVGLALHGPWAGAQGDAAVHEMRVAIIGTGETVQSAQHWLRRCRGGIDPGAGVDPLLFPSFPGMETKPGFDCRLTFSPKLTETLTPMEVSRITEAGDRDRAVEAAAVILRARLEALAERDVRPQVVVVALPDQVRRVAGAGRRPGARRKVAKPQHQLQLSFLDARTPEPWSTSRTLHRVVKAEGMRVHIPTQLVWPTTLEGGEGVQDDATRAWNFCTALYYKAGGVPWRVSGLDRGTCYVGISFYRPMGASDTLQTSMAQAFSDRGEGTVLRGTPVKWDKRNGPPCLSRAGARDLLAGVLTQFAKHHQQSPTRVVVYKSSQFSADEKAGIRDALGESVPYHDLLSLTPSTIRFLRLGKEPPVRGTIVQVDRGRYVVYTRGYVPFLRLYPGLRIPMPLDVRHEGSRAVTDVIAELIALTRMNWNSADFAAAEPITLGFARTVGLILSELPPDVTPETVFRYYM